MVTELKGRAVLPVPDTVLSPARQIAVRSPARAPTFRYTEANTAASEPGVVIITRSACFG
jgi:hypothetical protein